MKPDLKSRTKAHQEEEEKRRTPRRIMKKKNVFAAQKKNFRGKLPLRQLRAWPPWFFMFICIQIRYFLAQEH
jgi:hypothetical protein